MTFDIRRTALLAALTFFLLPLVGWAQGFGGGPLRLPKSVPGYGFLWTRTPDGASHVEVPGQHSYEGLMSGGQFHGEGTSRLPNGAQCSGPFERGQLPRGACTGADGSRYQGELKSFAPHGQGETTEKNGVRFSGRFMDGKPSGPGTLFLPSGLRVEGTWRGTQPEGQVTATWKDGWTYKGPYSMATEKNRPLGSYYDARGQKMGEAPLLDQHPPASSASAPSGTAETPLTARRLFEKGKAQVISELRSKHGFRDVVFERYLEVDPGQRTAHLGNPNVPVGAQTVAIALLRDDRVTTDVAIIRPRLLQEAWGGGHPTNVIFDEASSLRGAQLFGKVRARPGHNTVPVYVIVMTK